MVEEKLLPQPRLFLILLLWWNIDTCTAQMEPPQLTSDSVSDRSGVYPQQVLVFKCISKGSILSWRSNEYLNNDRHELAFTLVGVPGQMMTFESVVATLDNITLNGTTIHSTLNITVSEAYQTFTVTCFSKDSGLESSKSFYLIDEPPVKVAAENNVTCINDDVHFDCEVRSSSSLLLSGIVFGGETLICSHSNRSNYTIPIHDKMVTVLKTYMYPSESNDTSLLKCSITMNTEGLPTNVLLPISCLNVDIRTSSNNSFMISRDCPVTTALDDLIITVPAIASEASAAVGIYYAGVPLPSIFIPLSLCVFWMSS